MAKNKVIVYGEIGVDNLISVPHPLNTEKDAFVTRDEYLIGGYACNVSVLLSLWGIPVRISGYALGDDENGRRILDLLSKYPRIDTSHIRTHGNFATSFCFLYKVASVVGFTFQRVGIIWASHYSWYPVSYSCLSERIGQRQQIPK